MQLASNLSSLVTIPPSQIVSGEGPAEYMRERTSVMYDMTPLYSPSATGVYKSTNWFASGLMFVRIQQDPSSVRRSKSQAENGSGLVFLHRYIHGGIRGVMGEMSIDRDPNQIYLIDQARRVKCLQFANEVLGVFIPKSLIGYHPDSHAPFIRFSDNRMVGAVLLRSFDQVFRTILERDMIDPSKAQQLVSCVKWALGSDRWDGDVRRQAREATADLIRAYVERNLENPDLSTSLILKSFGVSRASLFRMFETEGGVRRFINKRRLYRAVLEIAETPGKRGSISLAATRWGFSSDSNFNRAVRDQFGVAPGSLVTSPLGELQIPFSQNKFHEFVQHA